MRLWPLPPDTGIIPERISVKSAAFAAIMPVCIYTLGKINIFLAMYVMEEYNIRTGRAGINYLENAV